MSYGFSWTFSLCSLRRAHFCLHAFVDKTFLRFSGNELKVKSWLFGFFGKHVHKLYSYGEGDVSPRAVLPSMYMLEPLRLGYL